MDKTCDILTKRMHPIGCDEDLSLDFCTIFEFSRNTVVLGDYFNKLVAEFNLHCPSNDIPQSFSITSEIF
jgi:hypothetical protein